MKCDKCAVVLTVDGPASVALVVLTYLGPARDAEPVRLCKQCTGETGSMVLGMSRAEGGSNFVFESYKSKASQ